MLGIGLRLPKDFVVRLDKLVKRMKGNTEWLAAGEPSRSSVLRLAAHYGVAEIERKLQAQKKRKAA